MKRLFLTIILVIGCSLTFAQEQPKHKGHRPNFEKFLKDRVSFVTRAMELDAADSVKFVPLYLEMLKEKGELMFKEIRPQWFEKKKCVDESKLSKEELEKLKEVPFINIVATRGSNDPKEMYDALGEDSYRDMLAEQFKNENSNFHIAVVVDMWVTGFDVPCLSVLYNDKPLQKHNLIQTISRVNRKFQVTVHTDDGDVIVEKQNGLIVDYIGIHEKMEQALKQYGGDGSATSKDDLEASKIIFDNELQILKELMHGCDLTEYFGDVPLKRLLSLQAGA